MQTGSIIDFYDDPHGVVLKELSAYEDLPPFIKEAEALHTRLPSLPDEAFGVVMFDQGQPIRKFA